MQSSEKISGRGVIDSIFYPVAGQSDKVIIHEYKLLKNGGSDEAIVKKTQEAFWQVYEKNYMQ